MNTTHPSIPSTPTRHSTTRRPADSVAAISRWFFRDMKPLPKWPVTTVLSICIAVAIGTSSYLLWAGLTSSPIAGCGGGGGWIDCDNVANSRWSLWFGVPVSLLALAIYVAMAMALIVGTVPQFERSTRKLGWTVVTAAVFAAGLSAVWFIGLQFLVLKHVCLYCMLAHACGLIASGTILWAGPLRTKATLASAGLSFIGFSVLVGGQLVAPPPDSFQIERFDTPAVFEPEPESESESFELMPPGDAAPNDDLMDDDLFSPPLTQHRGPLRGDQLVRLLASPNLLIAGVLESGSAETQADVESETKKRRIASIQGGAVKLDVAQWPHIGPADAKYVFVGMFDYCCPPCRETYKAIAGAGEQLGDQLAVVLVPVPLNSDCNPTVEVTGAAYKESCDLSKLAVAVWRVSPAQLGTLHAWMFAGDSPPSYAAAKAKAETLINPQKLDAELTSGVPDQYIDRYVEIYKRVGRGSIPKLMFPQTSVVGKFTSVDGLVDLIRRESR